MARFSLLSNHQALEASRKGTGPLCGVKYFISCRRKCCFTGIRTSGSHTDKLGVAKDLVVNAEILAQEVGVGGMQAFTS